MSVPDLRVVVAHASTVPALERGLFAGRLRALPTDGSLVIETCHRVELYSIGDGSLAPVVHLLPPGAQILRQRAAAEHAVELVVGLLSSAVGEDQVLHQVRTALDAGRAATHLPVELDRLFDLALRAGRRGRSWLPAHRPTIADVAFDLLPGPGASSLGGSRILIVGAGEIGRLAARSAMRRGGSVAIASRSPERAAALGRELGAMPVGFDPGSEIAAYDGVVVALRGAWHLAEPTEDRLVEQVGWVIDLSAPPALSTALAGRLAGRLVTIDDLARRPAANGAAHDDRIVGRLGRLAEATVLEYLDWCERSPRRETARAVVQAAEAARSQELTELWRRLPGLRTEERAEIERMTRHLSDRLLREPLERLGRDPDGSHDRAARELFGL
jgi:glutamyl-tRNA reductase